MLCFAERKKHLWRGATPAVTELEMCALFAQVRALCVVDSIFTSMTLLISLGFKEMRNILRRLISDFANNVFTTKANSVYAFCYT